jgi:hypothetical protein
MSRPKVYIGLPTCQSQSTMPLGDCPKNETLVAAGTDESIAPGHVRTTPIVGMVWSQPLDSLR